VVVAAVSLAAARVATAHAPNAILYGSGTAIVDGRLGAGEWKDARSVTFQTGRPPNDGGGTMPTTVLAMNDSANVYIAVVVGRGTYGGATQALFYFDNNHDGQISEGDENFAADAGIFSGVNFFDGFWTNCVPGGPPACPSRDTAFGGTNDGVAAAATDGSNTVLELSHPLDDADNAHDWSLSAGAVVGFAIVMNIFSETPVCNFGPNCQVLTIFPPGSLSSTNALGYGNLVIAPDRIAPEATIAEGPVEGSVTRSRAASFRFTGTDNLTPSDRLNFSCSLDGSAFGPCAQPVVVGEGRHTIAVRATDELGNTDATPATRSWRVDATPPARPRLSVRVVGRRAIVALKSFDRGGGRVRFLCAIDSLKLVPCRSRFSRPVAPGAHIVRARALDQAGNASAVATARFSR